ncbi:Cro/CI family transcriptional regulator [Pseudomonas sp. QTF5]|uniref:Cro/CI family transcriptional regulator n=1 Tax=Pseudomonas sp. QTF5 TaxID=1435425 RepID=UPI000685271B|nr:Cro/CI family transcriptional regulator [Pseudomonas sp. QTF5]
MQRIPLKEFVEKVGQMRAAAALGLTQGGISKAISADRAVYVIELSNGSFRAEEIKPFPGQVPRLAAESLPDQPAAQRRP